MGRPKGGSNRYYSKQLKLEIISELLSGESTRSLSTKYGINKSNIGRWSKQYKEYGEQGLETKRKPGNPYGGRHNKKHISEVDQLRYELAKAEVEIVKLKKQLEIQVREESQKK